MNKLANDFIIDGIVREELRRAGEEIDVAPGAYGKILRKLKTRGGEVLAMGKPNSDVTLVGKDPGGKLDSILGRPCPPKGK